MRYAALGPGKRLRPLLVLLTCEAVGGDWFHALPAAVAVECVHAFSLVHDDLPAMDDDDYRRGRLTTHKKYGEALGILAGDALLAFAFEELAMLEGAGVPAHRVVDAVRRLAHASGGDDLVGGQALDMAAEGRRVRTADVEAIHTRKTGALMGACLALGAIAGGADPHTVAVLDDAGRLLGFVFQIHDDLLNAGSSLRKLGKRAGTDAARGKATYHRAAGLPAALRKERSLLRSAQIHHRDPLPPPHPSARAARRHGGEGEIGPAPGPRGTAARLPGGNPGERIDMIVTGTAPRPRRGARRAALALLLILAALLGSIGCSQKLQGQFIPNQRPSVRLTWAPIDTTSEYFYVYRMNWVGFDPDGRVTRFEYAVDPPTVANRDTPWVSTTKNERTIIFTAAKPESLPTTGYPRTPRGQGFHVFVIRAVDNLGLPSEPVKRAFFSFGVAPTVQIDRAPAQRRCCLPSVTPAVRIKWTGKDFIDPNGFVFDKPVKYKYKLYKSGPDIPWSQWLQDPDSLRRQVAPEFAGWDSTGPDSAEVQYTNLTPQQRVPVRGRGHRALGRLLADLRPQLEHAADVRRVRGRAGAEDHALQLVLQLHLRERRLPLAAGPVVGGPAPGARRPGPDVQLDRRGAARLDHEALPLGAGPPEPGRRDAAHQPERLVPLEPVEPETVRDGRPLRRGGRGHRRGAQLLPRGRGHQRSREPGLDPVPGLPADVRQGPADRQRHPVQRGPDPSPSGRPDSLRAPSGVWPTRAELDTFLFAVGGVRWRMTPAGRLSPPGIFKGYRFDTLGTRYGQGNPTIPLGLLGQYRHVIWMTDLQGSLLENSPTSSTLPMTTLLYMSGPTGRTRWRPG